MEQKSDWEKDYDEIWNKQRAVEIANNRGVVDLEAVKSFISSLLSSQKQRLVELAEDHYWDTLEKDKFIVLQHIKSLIERKDV